MLHGMERAALAAVIGGRVRAERQARRWTLAQMADASGVSRRLIINVEQGTANPSLSTLLRISDALGIGLPALVSAPSPAPTHVARAGEGAVPWTRGPGDRHVCQAHAPGTRGLIQVLEGAVVVDVGEETVTLAAGDALTFPGDLPHAYRNPADAPARFTLAVFEPGVGVRSEVTHA
jgi:DNA-binding XRE family transcriptional regulator